MKNFFVVFLTIIASFYGILLIGNGDVDSTVFDNYERRLHDVINQSNSDLKKYKIIADQMSALRRGAGSQFLPTELSYADYVLQKKALQIIADIIFEERIGQNDEDFDYSRIEKLLKEIKNRLYEIDHFKPLEPLKDNEVDLELKLFEKIPTDRVRSLRQFLIKGSFLKRYPSVQEKLSGIRLVWDILEHYGIVDTQIINSLQKIVALPELNALNNDEKNILNRLMQKFDSKEMIKSNESKETTSTFDQETFGYISPNYIINRAEKIDEWANILLDARRFDSRILENFSEYTNELLKDRLIKGTILFLRFDLFPSSELIAKILENVLSLPTYLFQVKNFSGKALKGTAAVTRWVAHKFADKKTISEEIDRDLLLTSLRSKKIGESQEERNLVQRSEATTFDKKDMLDQLKEYIIDQKKELVNPKVDEKYATFFSSLLVFGDTIKSSFENFFSDNPQSYLVRWQNLEKQEQSLETKEKIKKLLDEFSKELATFLISIQMYGSFFDTFVPDENLSLSETLIAAFDFMKFKKSQFESLQTVLEDFKEGTLKASGTVFEPLIKEVQNKILILVNKASTQIVVQTLQLSNDILRALNQLRFEQPASHSEFLQETEELSKYKKLFEFSGLCDLSEYENALKEKIANFDSSLSIYETLVAEYDAIERGGFSTLLGNRLNFSQYSVQLLALEQLADFIFTQRFGLSDSMYDKQLTNLDLDYEAVDDLKRAIKSRIADIRSFVATEPLVYNKIDLELRLNDKIRSDKITALKTYLLMSEFKKKYPTAREQFLALGSVAELIKHYFLIDRDILKSIKKILGQKKLIENTDLQKDPNFLSMRLKVLSSDAEKDFLLQEEFARIRALSSIQEQREQLAKLSFFVKELKNKNIYLEQLITERIKQLAISSQESFATTPLGIELNLNGKIPQDQIRIVTDYVSTLLNKMSLFDSLSKEEQESLLNSLNALLTTMRVYGLNGTYADLYKFIEDSLELYSKVREKKECRFTTPQKSQFFSFLQGVNAEIPIDYFSQISSVDVRNYLQEFLQCSSGYLLKNAHSLQEWGTTLQEAQRNNSPVVEILKKYGDVVSNSTYFNYLISFLRFDQIPYSKDLALYLETLLWAPGAALATRQIPGKAVYGLGNLAEWFARKISDEKKRTIKNARQEVFDASQKARKDVDDTLLASGKFNNDREIIKAECKEVETISSRIAHEDIQEILEEIDRVKDFIKNQQGELLLLLDESRYKNFFRPFIDFSNSIQSLVEKRLFGPSKDSYLSQIKELEAQSFDNEKIQELSTIYQKALQECNEIVASFKFYISLFESFIPENDLNLEESAVATFELINFKIAQAETLNEAISHIKEGTRFAKGSSLEFLAKDLIERLSLLVHDALIKIIAKKVEVSEAYTNYLQNWAHALK